MPSLKIFLITLAFIGFARAEERLPSVEEATEQLLTAYGRNASYLARYEFKGNNKSLECTFVRDDFSELFVSHLVALQGDERMEYRVWNTDDDRLYVLVEGELMVTRGLQQEMSCLEDLGKVLAPDYNNDSHASAKFFLTKDSINNHLGFESSNVFSWKSEVKESSVHSMDEETITFETKENGLLSINRKTGVLERQKIKGKEGEDRVLELKEFKRDPGRKVIEDMTKDWSTLGAKDLNVVPYTLPIRLALFQHIIMSVESGVSDLGKLKDAFEEQQDSFKHFARLCTERDVDSPLAQSIRKYPLPKKEELKQIWITKMHGKADDDDAFKKFLLSEELRQIFLKKTVEVALEQPGFIDLVMNSVLGKGSWEGLQTKDETGKAAKVLCGRAMARSYLEVMLEHRMNQAWGRPDALD